MRHLLKHPNSGGATWFFAMQSIATPALGFEQKLTKIPRVEIKTLSFVTFVCFCKFFPFFPSSFLACFG